jgi:hypothetical protein
MMAMMQQSMEQSRVSGSSCCQISSQPQAPVSNQASPEQLVPHAIVSIESTVAHVPFIQKVRSNVGQGDLRRNSRAPSLLCTFLI